MSTALTVVVAGYAELAQAIERSGKVGAVVAVETTSQLRDAVTQGLGQLSPSELVFCFSDMLTDDIDKPVGFLLQWLSTHGYPVVLCARTPHARTLAAEHGVGLLEGPFFVNKVLGAISGLPGMPGLDTDPNGHLPLSEYLEVTGQPTPALSGWDQPAPAEPAPQQPAPQQRPQPEPEPQGGWGQPAQTQQPAPAEQSSWGQPAPQQPAPQQPAPQPGGWPQPEPAQQPDNWGQPAQPQQPDAAQPQQPVQQGGWPQPEPAQPQQPAPAEQGGWGQPPAQQDPWAQPPADQGWGGAPADFAADSEPAIRQGSYQPMHAPANRNGKVIAIVAPKGGTGKSGTALNLAAYTGLRTQGTGKKSIIVDANFQQADTGKYLGTYVPNITNVVRETGMLTPQSLSQYIVKRPDLNMDALLGPATPLEANPSFINSTLYVSVVQTLRQIYDYIFIDTPVAEVYHDIFDNFVLSESDFLAVIVAPNIPTLLNTDLWLKAITQPDHAGGRNVPQDKIGIILNRAEEDIGCSEEEVQQELANWRFLGSIPEAKEWKLENNRYGIVASRNYTQINTALAQVMFAASGDPAFQVADLAPASGGGILGKLKGLLSK